MRTYRASGRVWLALLVAVAVGSMVHRGAGAQLVPIERVSVDDQGGDPNDRSELPAVNFDGSVVAFKSAASNLVSDDTNAQIDVFAYDRNSGATERIPPRAQVEGEANGESYPPALDAQGRIVAFGSAARNLVRGDFNQFPDMFSYDRVTQISENLSLVFDENDEGRLGGRVPDLAPGITADGNVVVFVSDSPAFSSVDRNEVFDVFAYDRGADVVELISITNLSGTGLRSGNGPSAGGVISGDGRYVVFCSDASNLVQGGPAGVAGIFRRNREAGETTLIGTLARGSCAQRELAPSVSSDGETIAFTSNLPLDGEDSNGTWDVYLWNSGALARASRSLDGGSADGPSTFASISGDGRFVAYQTSATNIVPDDNNGAADVMVFDYWMGQTRRVSIGENGSEASADSGAPQISGDGVTVVFQSRAGLVDSDHNGALDIYAVTNSLSFTPTPAATEEPTEIQTSTPVQTPTGNGGGTPTSTSDTGSVTPTIHATAIVTATRTPTGGGGGTPTATAPGSGGGGGCSCRIDQDASQGAGMWLLSAMPLALLLARGRRRGA